MEYRERNRRRIILIAGAVATILLLAGLWLQKKFLHTGAAIVATAFPARLSVGDTLYYADRTPFRAIKEWTFGDGNISLNDSGYYIYRKPGYYRVSITLNGTYTRSFEVQVLDKVQGNISDSITAIEAPAEAMQFENVVFRARSGHAKLFSWKFGDGSGIEQEQMTIHAFELPGNYEVSLYTDETAYPITHKIKIIPGFKIQNDSISVEDVYRGIDDDFKRHLQKIADGEAFNLHYNYLLKKYLCRNDNAAVKVNTTKINNFYSYCAGLQFDRNVLIQAVKVTVDDSMDCVTKVDITQGK